MTDAISSAQTQQKLVVKDVPVTAKVTVTYVFTFTSSSLSLPYVVSVNGKAQNPKKRTGSGQAIKVVVDSGSTVALFLNSDACESYRQNPVYAVKAGAKDIRVDIKEHKGKLPDKDTPVFVATKSVGGKQTDHYTAKLTSDIWLKVSHEYTSAEAEAMVPATADAAIKTAVSQMYQGLSSRFVVVALPDGKSIRLDIPTDAFNNAKTNIHGTFNDLTDGVTRVHPKAFIALFESAARSGVTSIRLSSTWRPMLGSIAHRIGLGLDINFVGKGNSGEVRINRETAVGTDKTEQERLVAYNKAQATNAAAKTDLAKAETALKTGNSSPERLLELTAQRDLAKANVARTEREEQLAKTAWYRAKQRRGPQVVSDLREALLEHDMVSQVIDPWMVDTNTQDNVDAQRNKNTSELEKVHSNHLHITVRDTTLL